MAQSRFAIEAAQMAAEAATPAAKGVKSRFALEAEAMTAGGNPSSNLTYTYDHNPNDVKADKEIWQRHQAEKYPSAQQINPSYPKPPASPIDVNDMRGERPRIMPSGRNLRNPIYNALEAVIDPYEDVPVDQKPRTPGFDPYTEFAMGAATPGAAMTRLNPNWTGFASEAKLLGQRFKEMPKFKGGDVLFTGKGFQRTAKYFTGPRINKILDLRPVEIENGQNTALRLISDKVTAATKPGLQEAMLREQAKLSPIISHELATNNPGTTVDLIDNVDTGLAEATKRIGLKTDAAFTKSLENIRADALAKMQEMGIVDPTRATNTEAQLFKAYLGKSVKWTGLPFEGDINTGLVKAYGNIRDSIINNVPSVADTLRAWGDYEVGLNGIARSIAKDSVGQGTATIRHGGYTAVDTTLGRLFPASIPKTKPLPPGLRPDTVDRTPLMHRFGDEVGLLPGTNVRNPKWVEPSPIPDDLPRNVKGELVFHYSGQPTPEAMAFRHSLNMRYQPKLLTESTPPRFEMPAGDLGSTVNQEVAAASRFAPATREIRTGRILSQSTDATYGVTGKGVDETMLTRSQGPPPPPRQLQGGFATPSSQGPINQGLNAESSSGTFERGIRSVPLEGESGSIPRFGEQTITPTQKGQAPFKPKVGHRMLIDGQIHVYRGSGVWVIEK
jgi:hypothetical protein